MSKNISIKEGNENKQFTAKKLQTNLQNGGTCFWVPEDETKLVTKRIDKAGFYAAKRDGAYGYSKVTVTGIASDDDLKVIEKTVTESGSYSAKNDNAAGYNIARVNVKGGGTYTDETGKKVTPDPSISPGSAVVGVNPDTGNEEVEKIDDDGNLKTLELASYIQLDTPPTKMEYQDGERIMMSGAVAHGYKKDGTPYKGTLAASELPWHQYGDSESGEYSEDFLPGGIVFEMPLYADISKAEGGGDSVPSGNIFNLTSFAFLVNKKLTIRTGESNPITYEVTASSTVYLTYVGGSQSGTYASRVYYLFASESGDLTDSGSGIVHSYTYNGKTVYYVYHRTANHANIVTPWITPQYSSGENNVGKAAWLMVYGGYGEKKQTITLTWPREGDRKHLQTTFDITVTE